jgi:hypothetical protein
MMPMAQLQQNREIQTTETAKVVEYAGRSDQAFNFLGARTIDIPVLLVSSINCLARA